MSTSVSNLWRLIRPYWLLLAVAFGAMVLDGAMNLLEPWPLKVIFDNVIGNKTNAGVARSLARCR